MTNAGSERGSLAVVADEVHHANRRILLRHAVQDGVRAVGAAVVDEHDLVGGVAHRGGDRLHERAHIVHLVVDGDHH